LSRNLQVVLIAVPVTAFVLLAASLLLWPINSPEWPINTLDGPFSRWHLPGYRSIAVWVVIAVAAAASPIHVPRGSYISVAAAPVIAAGFLGGPAAAGLVAVFGTTELRELRGQVPWYGVVYNHSIAVCAAIVSGVTYLAITNGHAVESPVGLIGGVVAGIVFVVVNTGMSSCALALG
jgi:hypothetical protein